jgi:hypothetical protein
MTSMADEVTAKAGQHWDKLETIFEERTAKALKKLGVPTAKDVQALTARVDALSAQIAGPRQGCRQDRRQARPGEDRRQARAAQAGRLRTVDRGTRREEKEDATASSLHWTFRLRPSPWPR